VIPDAHRRKTPPDGMTVASVAITIVGYLVPWEGSGINVGSPKTRRLGGTLTMPAGSAFNAIASLFSIQGDTEVSKVVKLSSPCSSRPYTLSRAGPKNNSTRLMIVGGWPADPPLSCQPKGGDL
jgi:hypothetical protein